MNVEIIEKIKNKHPEICEELVKLEKEELNLFYKKQNDYGTENIRAGQNLSIEEGRRIALLGITFRLNEKIQRLFNLLLNNNLSANEPLIDSFQDISLLAKIAMIVNNNQWK